MFQGTFTQIFAQIFEELTAQVRRNNIKSNATPKIENRPKPRNFDAMPWFWYFNARKSKCPRRFLERPWNLHTDVLNVPLSSLLREFPFSLEMRDPLRPTCPENNKNPNIWRKTNEKTNTHTSVKRSAGAHKTRVQNFRVYLSKTSWTLDSEFGVYA